MQSVTCMMFNCTFLRLSHELASHTITLRNNVKNVIITIKSQTLGFPHLKRKKTPGKIGLNTEIIRFILVPLQSYILELPRWRRQFYLPADLKVTSRVMPPWQHVSMALPGYLGDVPSSSCLYNDLTWNQHSRNHLRGEKRANQQVVFSDSVQWDAKRRILMCSWIGPDSTFLQHLGLMLSLLWYSQKIEVLLIHIHYCESLWLSLHLRFKEYINTLQIKTAPMTVSVWGTRGHGHPGDNLKGYWKRRCLGLLPEFFHENKMRLKKWRSVSDKVYKKEGKRKMTKLLYSSVGQIMMRRISGCHGDVLWLVGFEAAPHQKPIHSLSSKLEMWMHGGLISLLPCTYNNKVGKIKEVYGRAHAENIPAANLHTRNDCSPGQLRRSLNAWKRSVNKKWYLRSGKT